MVIDNLAGSKLFPPKNKKQGEYHYPLEEIQVRLITLFTKLLKSC